MDGLEAVELKLSEVLEDNESFRIDSEYFKKEYLDIYQIIKNNNIKRLNILGETKGGKRLPLGENFCNCKDGVYYIRAEDIKNGFVSYENSPKISLKLHKYLIKYQTSFNDILLTIVGNSIGDIGIVKFNLEKCNLTENVAKIINIKEIKQDYLFVYFMSKFGQIQIKKEKVGTAQPKLALERIKNFIIPIFSNNFQSQIEKLVKLSYQKLEKSKTLYKQAEELLLKELDLLDFEPSNENIAIKSFSESFLKTGRLDSEYYQPKYDEILEKIKSIKYDKLGNIVNILKSIEPGSEAYQENGIPFVRVSNLTKFEISKPEIYLSYNLFDDKTLEKLQPKKDTILLSKDGTVGITYNVKKDSNFITSGAILHLSIKGDDVLPEYLTLVLNSLLVQMQSQRDAGGSIIKHWKPSEIKKILIPIIDNSIQTQIEEKIKSSFNLKEKSKQLLDIAKKAVEIAIEQDEDIAMEYINDQI